MPLGSYLIPDQNVSRHLPDVETMVNLQQGLQQVYCVQGVNKADAVLTEPNAIAYAQGSTYLQLHKAAVCFYDISQIVRKRIAPIPRQQIMVQMYAAMNTMGLCPRDLVEMKDPQHMFEFIKASLASAMMDGKQTPYYSDYVLQSVDLVQSEAVALTNLQPMPGSVEYAPGCSACFYRKHEDGQWYRYMHCFICALNVSCFYRKLSGTGTSIVLFVL